MTMKTRTILDTAHGVCVGSLDINEVYHGPNGAVPFRILKRRLREGLTNGVDIIEVDNGKFCFTIIPTRGMGIWKGRCGNVELKWDSGVHGPVNPAMVPLHDPSGLGWLEGFNEWLVRCGLESNGAPEFDKNGILKYGLHGRIANIPARRVKVTFDSETGDISVSGVVEEARALTKRMALYVTYRTKAGSSELTVHDRILNRASVPAEFELLYHINTGRPFLTPGAKVVIPFEEMSPRNADAVDQLPEWDHFRDEIPGSPETCFFFDMAVDRENMTKALLINAKGNQGLTVSYSKKDFPYFTLWKMQRPNGDTYVTGMEPSINFPNTRSFEKEHGRVAVLQPGESRSFEMTLGVLHDGNEISETVHYIKRLQNGAAGTILQHPRPDWAE